MAGMVMIYHPVVHRELLSQLAAIHSTCLCQDDSVATFSAPVTYETLLDWWYHRLADIENQKRVIFVALEDDTYQPGIARVTGFALLSLEQSSCVDTGLHRASVETIMVKTSHRRGGTARKLMAAVEAEALRRGYTLLVSLFVW